VGIAALCLASAFVALATAHHYRAWQPWAHDAAEPEPPHSTVPLPLRVATDDTRTTRPAEPPPVTPPSAVAPAEFAAPALDEDERAALAARLPLPQPIVLHVEPTVDLDAPAAAPAAASAAPSASTNAAPAASATPAASAASAPAAIVACGSTTCAAGKVCCNASCGICADPGELCSQFHCGMPAVPTGTFCGPSTCNVGEVCCNASCGVCIRPGETCDATRRCSGEITYPESQSCGMQTCNVGLVCCNPSCGICAPPGEKCSDSVCN